MIKNSFLSQIRSFLILTILVLCKSAQTDAISPSLYLRDVNQFLSHSKETCIALINTTDQPVLLDIAYGRYTFQKTHPISFQPAEHQPIISNHQNEIAFPVIDQILDQSHIMPHLDESICAMHSWIIETLHCDAQGNMHIQAHEGYVIAAVQRTPPSDPTNDIFIAIHFTMPLTLIIQKQPYSVWQTRAQPFSFESALHVRADPVTEAFRDYILENEAITPIDFYQRIQYLYHKKLEFPATTSDQLHIPKTIHIIWLTDTNEPTMLPLNWFSLFNETLRICRTQDGWTYHLWLSCLSSLPFDFRCDGFSIIIHLIHALAEEWIAPKAFETAMMQRNYGKASDILRYEILYQQGGVYIDVDFAFTQSVEWLHYHYDFYSGMEGESSISACNAMIGTKPRHPIIYTCLKKINETSAYLSEIVEPLRTLAETGPFLLSLMIYRNADQEGNRDIIFPPDVFFADLYEDAHIDDEAISLQRIRTRAGKHNHSKLWLTAS